MEQGQEPRSFCPAEGARIHPSRHLGPGRTGTEEAGGDIQGPYRTAHPFSRARSGAGATRLLAETPAALVLARHDRLPGMPKCPVHDSGGLADPAQQLRRECLQKEIPPPVKKASISSAAELPTVSRCHN